MTLISVFPGSAVAAPRPSIAAEGHGPPSFGSSTITERRSIEAILEAETDPGDPSTFVNALGAFVSERWGWQEIGGSEVYEESYVAEGTEYLPPVPSAYPYDGGDLDGDGGEDVIIESYDDKNGWLEARRGSDGSLLWKMPQGNYYDEAMREDVTGDGKDDLLLYKQIEGQTTSSEECSGGFPASSCTRSWTERFRTKIGIRSGADGSIAWVRSYDGKWSWTEDNSYGLLDDEWSRSDLIKNGWIFPELIPNGNGGYDLLVNVTSAHATERHHTRNLGAVEQSDGEYDFDGSAVGQVIDGTDGSILRELQPFGSDSVAEFEGAGDLTGDGTSDFVLTREDNPHQDYECTNVWVAAEDCDSDWADQQTSIVGWDGAENEALWELPLPKNEGSYFDYYSVWPLQEDLTGDGIPDIYASTYGWDGITDFSQRQIVSGADGSVAWAFPEGYVQWVIVPSLGGNPGADIWTTDVESVDVPTGGQSVTLISRRIDGATGGTIFESSATETDPTASDTDAWGDTVGDLDGDGFPDRIWDVEFYEDSEHADFQGGVYLIESGRTGVTFRRTQYGDDYTYLWSSGDLDGDGIGDLMSEVHVYDSSDDSVEIANTGFKMPDDQTLWEIVDDDQGSWVWTAGDQDGVPGLELLHKERIDDGDASSIVISSLSGRDGSVRWSRTVGS